MELKGFVRKFTKGDHFDPLKDSKLNGDPVFPDSVLFEPPKCDLCSSQMRYLMQLSVSQNRADRTRLLFVYYCINDVTRDKGWKIYRYSTEKRNVNDTGNSEPIFGDENNLSSWVDDLDISATDTVALSDSSMRVILENDVVQEDYDVHSIVLLEKYKNRSKEEIDEEDLADFQSIKLSKNQLEPDQDDDTDSEDDSDRDEEIEAINNFHNYISARPNTYLRINKGGQPISFLTNVSYNSCCSKCGSPATFELQLLPNIVKCLANCGSQNPEKRSKLHNNVVMSLGGVVFYTCDSDCLTSGLVQEHSYVLLYR